MCSLLACWWQIPGAALLCVRMPYCVWRCGALMKLLGEVACVPADMICIAGSHIYDGIGAHESAYMPKARLLVPLATK